MPDTSVRLEPTNAEILGQNILVDMGEIVECHTRAWATLSEKNIDKTDYLFSKLHPTDAYVVRLLTRGNSILENVIYPDENSFGVLALGTIVLIGYVGYNKFPFILKTFASEVVEHDPNSQEEGKYSEGFRRDWITKVSQTELPTMSPGEKYIYSSHGNSIYLRKDGALVLRGGFHHQDEDAPDEEKDAVSSSFYAILGGVQGPVPNTGKRAILTIGTDQTGPGFAIDESGNVAFAGTNMAVMAAILSKVFGTDTLHLQAGGWSGTPKQWPDIDIGKGSGLLEIVTGRDQTILIGRDKVEKIKRNEDREVRGTLTEDIKGLVTINEHDDHIEHVDKKFKVRAKQEVVIGSDATMKLGAMANLQVGSPSLQIMMFDATMGDPRDGIDMLVSDHIKILLGSKRVEVNTGGITITSDSGSVTMNNDGGPINISAQGAVSVESRGGNVLVKGSAKVTVEAGSNVEVQAGAQVNIEGSEINVGQGGSGIVCKDNLTAFMCPVISKTHDQPPIKVGPQASSTVKAKQ